MRSTSRRLLAVAAATGAVAFAGPAAGASAAVIPPLLPIQFPVPALGGIAVGGNQIGSGGCIGTNRPSTGGNNGSTSNQACGGLAYSGAHIGQIGLGEPGLGTTVINSPFTEVNVSSGSITQIGP
jgi:hypothetical protein